MIKEVQCEESASKQRTIVPAGNENDVMARFVEEKNLRNKLLAIVRHSKGDPLQLEVPLTVLAQLRLINEFAMLTSGSRYIQRRLDQQQEQQEQQEQHQNIQNDTNDNFKNHTSEVECAACVRAMAGVAVELSMHGCGNYALQAVIRRATTTQRHTIVDVMRLHLAELATMPYASRVVQTLLLIDDASICKTVLDALEPELTSIAQTPHGCLMLENCIKEHHAGVRDALMHAMESAGLQLACSEYGHRVIVRLFQFTTPAMRHPIVTMASTAISALCTDEYGHHVIRRIVTFGCSLECDRIVRALDAPIMLALAMHQYGTHIVQLMLTSPMTREVTCDCLCDFLVDDWSLRRRNRELSSASLLYMLCADPYGSHVIRHLYTCSFGVKRSVLAERLLSLGNRLRHVQYGRAVLRCVRSDAAGGDVCELASTSEVDYARQSVRFTAGVFSESKRAAR